MLEFKGLRYRVSGIRPPAHRGGAYAPAGSWTRRRPIGRDYAAAKDAASGP